MDFICGEAKLGWLSTGTTLAYPNMLQLVADLGIEDRLQWKKHSMVFAMPNVPGTFSRFDFPDLPGPFNALVAILGNNDMLTWPQKIRFGIALLPALLGGDKYIQECDNMTISEWLRKTGAPPEVEEEIFVAMSKALAFIDPERLSATVVLTALNRHIILGDNAGERNWHAGVAHTSTSEGQSSTDFNHYVWRIHCLTKEGAP
eukprot:scaffold321453_cov53-Prasinocladus_malaysianus.AAC.2